MNCVFLKNRKNKNRGRHKEETRLRHVSASLDSTQHAARIETSLRLGNVFLGPTDQRGMKDLTSCSLSSLTHISLTRKKKKEKKPTLARVASMTRSNNNNNTKNKFSNKQKNNRVKNKYIDKSRSCIVPATTDVLTCDLCHCNVSQLVAASSVPEMKSNIFSFLSF